MHDIQQIQFIVNLLNHLKRFILVIYLLFIFCYLKEFWYWEFILFSCRFFIACFTSIQFVGGDYTNFIFLVILVIYFGLQIHFKPFAYGRVNRVESLCLVLLISAFAAANFVDNDDVAKLDGD